MLEAGDADVPAIDAAMRAAGFPMGPFELMDLIGIDVNLAAARGVYEGLGRPERLRPSPIQERLVAAGHLGRKSGRGVLPLRSGWHGDSCRRTGSPDRATHRRRRDRRADRRAPSMRKRGSPRPTASRRRPTSSWRCSSGPGTRLERRGYDSHMTRDSHRPLREAWIVEAVRTPIGRYGGALAGVRPDDLAAAVLRAVVDRAGPRPGPRGGRHPRLRQPGRRGQPRRRTHGAACWPASRSRSAA